MQTTGHAMASETVVAIVNDTALTAAMQRVSLCMGVESLGVCVTLCLGVCVTLCV